MMNRIEFLQFHKKFTEDMHNLVVIKNNDYAHLDSNPFGNFEKAELLGICTNEAGILVRIMDKISRIVSYLNKGELLVKDESVLDTILDGANYLIILAAYLESKKDSTKYSEQLDKLDKKILDILEKEDATEFHIFRQVNEGYDDYSFRNIIYALDKLLQLNKIKVDNNYYSLITK